MSQLETPLTPLTTTNKKPNENHIFSISKLFVEKLLKKENRHGMDGMSYHRQREEGCCTIILREASAFVTSHHCPGSFAGPARRDFPGKSGAAAGNVYVGYVCATQGVDDDDDATVSRIILYLSVCVSAGGRFIYCHPESGRKHAIACVWMG